MGELIQGICIQKSNLPKNAPVEECEKVEDGFVYRFQRRTDVSPIERFLRIFSDLFDGVTKARGTLCHASEKLPDLIYVRGHAIPIKDQSERGATGISTAHQKPWPRAFDTIDIIFKAPSSEIAGAAKPAEATRNSAAAAKPAPAPSSREGRSGPGHPADAPQPLPPANRRTDANDVIPPQQNAAAKQAPPPVPARDGRRRLGDPESADAIQPAPPPAQNAAPPAANPDDLVLAQVRPDVAPQAQVPQDPIPPAPPLPAEIKMEAPPAPPLPAKDGIDEAPPAPPLTKTLIEKPATTPSAAGPVGAEALQQARQGLKKTADDPALREAGRKPPPTGADDLTSIMQKKFASMRMANGDPDPAKSAKDADEWDE